MVPAEQHAIKIRGLSDFEMAALKEMVQASNYTSVNAFLLALIRDELSQKMILKYGDRTLNYLETNAQVMNNMIDAYNTFIGGNEKLLKRVQQLLNILEE